MNNCPNEPFVPFTVTLTNAGMMTTVADELEILVAGTELTVKDIRKRAIAEKEEDWAEVTARKDGKAIDGFIPLELLQSFAGLLPDDPEEEKMQDYPRRADCPSLLEFPLMRQVFGPAQVELGRTRAEIQKVLSNLEKTGTTSTGIRWELKIEGPVAFDVSSVRLDFESDIFVRCRLMYQYAPVGSTPLSKLKHEVYTLLGLPDGYIEDSEGNKHKAWKKADILITASEEPILHWYGIEFFREAKTENQSPRQRLQGLRVENGLKLPSNLIRLLTTDITGINYEDSRTIDPVFADMVLIGPMFLKRYLGGSLTEEKADRAMIRVDSDVFEGRVLLGIKRMLPLADPRFESSFALYHDGLLRNATDEERLTFYRFIDFEIKGKPVYIAESKAGRVLICLDEKERIKWIEYLDDWRRPHKPNLGKLLGVGANSIPNAPARSSRDVKIKELRELARVSFDKGHWEAATTHLQTLLMQGDPLDEIAPKIVTCLLNVHEDLLPHDAIVIEDLLRRLESAGHSAVAGDLRRQLDAKRPKQEKPWWKLW